MLAQLRIKRVTVVQIDRVTVVVRLVRRRCRGGLFRGRISIGVSPWNVPNYLPPVLKSNCFLPSKPSC